MKDVEEKLDIPPLKEELRKFVDWVAGYTLSPRGMVLRMCLRMGEHLGPARERIGVRLAGAPPQRMTAARQRVLALLADGFARGKSEAAQEAGVSAGVIDGLIDEGTLETVVLPPEPVARAPDPEFAAADLTPAQRDAADALRDTVAKGGYSATLVDGVTGSGKTEVYFEAVAEAVRRGRQTLILMPEIALTAQFLDRFAERFGVRPAEWHSQLTPRKRARTWAAVAAGEVSVVVGARSALFLPYADLGLIVVDEEHDPAYKQEDGVHYHARDMAVVRANVAEDPDRAGLGHALGRDRGQCAARALPAPASAGAFRRGASAVDRGDRSQARRPAARALHRAAAGRSGEDRGRARRAGAAVPQPPRLRAAHALPRLRLSARLPELRRLAGRPPLPAPARLPPLRLRDAAARKVPGLRGDRELRRLRARRRAAGGGSGGAVSGHAHPGPLQRSRRRRRAHARGACRDRAGLCRHRHRHAACRQGAPFPQAQPGRHRRRRSRPRQRRPARGRAHVPAPAPGRRPRRPRGGPRHRLPADPPARASGDARAHRRRPRGVLRERDRAARSRPTIRRSGALRAWSSRPPTSTPRKATRAASPPQHHARTTCACSARRKPRSRWCAAGIVSACW